MADGAAPSAGDVQSALRPKLSDWLFGTRSGWLTLWISIAVVAFTAVISVVALGLGQTIGENERWYLLAASTVILLPLLLLSLDPEETVASGPRLLLPVLTTILLASLTTWAVVDAVTGWRQLERLPPQTAFFALLGLALVPRVWNAALFAYHRAHNRRTAEAAARNEPSVRDGDQQAAVDREVQQYRNAESIGALLATVLFIFIIGGALAVGSLDKDPELGAGLGIVIFAIVIGLFATIVFLDWISRFPPLRSVAKALHHSAPRLRFLADFYDWIDTGLVRLGSHVAGADHLKTRSRYSILGGTLICLAVLAWFLPTPLGLIPVAIGLILALSLSRLWSWVEDDRDMAATTQFSPLAPQRVGFREDFRDETLLGFIFVLILLPIGIMQTHEGFGQSLFVERGTDVPVAGRDNFFLWLGYFGFELAKALPIVDWADIYKLGPGADSIEPTRALGMHAVFVARALVDLILIAALLQAVGIATRNSQQKSLFAVGRIKRLDELVEKAALAQAVRETRKSGEGAKFELKRLAEPELVDFRKYDLGRLRQIYASSPTDSDIRGFIAQIFAQRGETLAPTIDVAREIAETHRNELALFKTFEQALNEHDARIHTIDLHDIQTMMFALRRQAGFRDFKEHLMTVAATRIGASPGAVFDMLMTVAVGKEDERDAYKQIANIAGLIAKGLLAEVTDRQQVADALAAVVSNGRAAFGVASDATRVALIDALEKRLKELAPSSS